jgi:hypothetical protein
MSVQPISPHLAQLDAPQLLRSKPGWLMWRYEHNPNNPDGKPLKVPYYINGAKRHGTQGSDSDRANLVTFEVAKRVATRRGFSGVGFCLNPEFDIVAGDFDNCVDSPGQEDRGVNPEVLDLTLGTYAEFSPSGTGVRAFWRGESRGNGKDPHGTPFGFEVFSTKGFVTFTGIPLWQTEFNGCEDHVAPIPAHVDAFITARLGANLSRAATPTGEAVDVLIEYAPKRNVSIGQATEMLTHLDPNMPRQPWLNVGMALHHEFDGSPEAFSLWDTWSANGATYNEGVSIERVWESFKTNPGRTPITMGTVQKMVDKAIRSKEGLAPTVNEDGEIVDPFRAIPVAEFASGDLDVEWLVKDLLPRASLSVAYGAPGSGKTFAVLDMAMAVARGANWRNDSLRTTQGTVVYVVCEGSSGFKKRLKAFSLHYGVDLDTIPFYVINTAPNLLEEAHTKRLIDEINALGEVALVVIDTLSRTLHGGDENSSVDMGKAISHCTTIYQHTGASLLLVHHSGKDASKGSRGWSGIKGAVDAELEVTLQTGFRNLHVEKQKDAESGQNYAFNLKPVPLYVNQYGEAVSSCVVEHLEDAPMVKKLKPGQQRVFEALCSLAPTGDTFTSDEVIDRMVSLEKKRREDLGESLSPGNERQLKSRAKKYLQDFAYSQDSGVELQENGGVTNVEILDQDRFDL